MSDMARIALGPKRHPTRNGEPVSNGIPSTATSTPSSWRVCGSRMKVVMPTKRGVRSESSGRKVGMSSSAPAGGGVPLDEELEQGLSGEPDRRLGGVVVGRHLGQIESRDRMPREHADGLEELAGLQAVQHDGA